MASGHWLQVTGLGLLASGYWQFPLPLTTCYSPLTIHDLFLVVDAFHMDGIKIPGDEFFAQAQLVPL